MRLWQVLTACIFLSTLPARGATWRFLCKHHPGFISIHAPREGSDAASRGRSARPPYFYPRSPRGERPRRTRCGAAPMPYFYPRSPRGERHAQHRQFLLDRQISIHAPREGSDVDDVLAAQLVDVISIHAPREGSDTVHLWLYLGAGISIHAPREGSDMPHWCTSRYSSISIHAPREGSDRPAPAYSRCR